MLLASEGVGKNRFGAGVSGELSEGRWWESWNIRQVECGRPDSLLDLMSVRTPKVSTKPILQIPPTRSRPELYFALELRTPTYTGVLRYRYLLRAERDSDDTSA